MSKYPDLRDRLIDPIKVIGAPYGWAYKPTSQELLEEFIFKDKNKALTFMSLEFSRLRIISDRSIDAQVCLNTDERSFEMHINPTNLKSLYWEGQLSRSLHRNRAFKMPDLDAEYLPKNFDKLTPEQQAVARLATTSRYTRDDILWSGLPKVDENALRIVGFNDADEVRESVRETFRQIITHEFGHLWFWHLHSNTKDCPSDARSSLNIATDGLVNYHLNLNYGHMRLAHREITDGYLALLPILFCRLEFEFERFRGMSHDEFYEKFKNTELTYQEYLTWRVIRSQIHNFKKWSISTIIEKVEEIRDKIVNYKDTIVDLAVAIRGLFPDAGLPGGKLHCKPGGHDPKFKPISDMSPSEMPPGFVDLLEHMLPTTGVGGDMLKRTLAELKQMKLSQRTIKAIAHYTEKDPSRFVIKKMKIELFNKSQPTFRPNKFPARKLMAASNSLSTSAPPRFYPKMTADEIKSGNRLDIYVDVSGSIGAMIPRIMAFIRNLKNEFAVRAWQFSDNVQEISDEDLKDGVYRSTGGNTGEALLKHIRNRSETVSNFVCFGDRWYGNYKQETFARPITILDMALKNDSKTDTWFKPGKNLTVWSLIVNKDFEIEEEMKISEVSKDKRR